MPQFVAPSAGGVSTQIFLLGSLYVGLALVTDGAYALAAGGLRRWAIGRFKGQHWGRRVLQSTRYVTTSIYIGLGVKAALTERPS